MDDLVELRERTYRAHRTALGVDSAGLPSDFGEVVDAVTRSADPLARPAAELRWRGRASMDGVDVASNVATGDRLDVTGREATSSDA